MRVEQKYQQEILNNITIKVLYQDNADVVEEIIEEDDGDKEEGNVNLDDILASAVQYAVLDEGSHNDFEEPDDNEQMDNDDIEQSEIEYLEENEVEYIEANGIFSVTHS